MILPVPVLALLGLLLFGTVLWMMVKDDEL